MPLELIDKDGVFRRYQLEIQAEVGDDVCSGCAFLCAETSGCAQPHTDDQREADCLNNLRSVWKEIEKERK